MGELVAQGEIGCYTVESMTQFSVLYGAALAARKPISLLLRLTSGNQFGMDQEEIRWILDHYGEDPCLDIRGIQYFSGTQKHSLKRLARELALVDQFLASLTPVHPAGAGVWPRVPGGLLPRGRDGRGNLSDRVCRPAGG